MNILLPVHLSRRTDKKVRTSSHCTYVDPVSTPPSFPIYKDVFVTKLNKMTNSTSITSSCPVLLLFLELISSEFCLKKVITFISAFQLLHLSFVLKYRPKFYLPSIFLLLCSYCFELFSKLEY